MFAALPAAWYYPMLKLNWSCHGRCFPIIVCMFSMSLYLSNSYITIKKHSLIHSGLIQSTTGAEHTHTHEPLCKYTTKFDFEHGERIRVSAVLMLQVKFFPKSAYVTAHLMMELAFSLARLYDLNCLSIWKKSLPLCCWGGKVRHEEVMTVVEMRCEKYEYLAALMDNNATKLHFHPESATPGTVANKSASVLVTVAAAARLVIILLRHLRVVPYPNSSDLTVVWWWLPL